ncbi:glycoside hydrolase N-terminal domain-containing protein [Arenibacter sp. ARW7G5Y1]|uniref:glycosyl hydrolase family 95 catalytic domain-containing protein n=1 Tax=Arenibacter sp. ARW7G5Y1 TaxID=2135619 RepID=UPI000DA06007|nr:glycoside hydrolase N-terminal domain-containing protein [Arenibacter sp. ARW7G5Y1]PXX23770.1 alpha-L-fucosidase 2 [Arenibacter sp. ARW7G5Y1]
MKHLIAVVILISIGILTCQAQSSESRKGSLKLWYKQQAADWDEALPLGNGRLGAMVFGGIEHERLQLNEGSLWAGEPEEAYPENFKENLAILQNLILDGKLQEAENFGSENMTKSPTYFRSYQPLGNIFIDMKHESEATDYYRELDLQTGVSLTRYQVGNLKITREVLISAIDDLIAVKISSDGSGLFSCNVSLSRDEDAQVISNGDTRLDMIGQIIDFDSTKIVGGAGRGGKHMKFYGSLRAKSIGGSIRTVDNKIVMKNCEEVILLFTAATDYSLEKLNFDRTINPIRLSNTKLDRVKNKSWTSIREDHIADYSSMFDRVALDLGSTLQDTLPTDVRLAESNKGAVDPGLSVLRFQYGRYLLMSSSRKPGRLPIGLQGIWNHLMWAPWSADYHLNVNFQMNYWAANVTNLEETLDPLWAWFRPYSKRGEVAAQKLFGYDKGWVGYHLSNPFGRVTPGGSTHHSQWINGVVDPFSGAWMAMAFWRHYEFTEDKEFLNEKAYPILKGAAEFIDNYLIKDKEGKLTIAPSTSPENEFYLPNTNLPVRASKASTYHNTLTRAVLEAYCKTAEILGVDEPFVRTIKEHIELLPPLYRINSNGAICEWAEDYKEVYPQHRHSSHLLGVFPFNFLTTDSDPKILQAAKTTMAIRCKDNLPAHGWSKSFNQLVYARLGDGENAYDQMNVLLKTRTSNNLFNQNPPFQIDGNFGTTSGIAEMLLQSHAGYIRLLPAIPAIWSKGSFKGLCARGNFEINLEWKAGKPVKAIVFSKNGNDFRIKTDLDFKVKSEGRQLTVRKDKSACHSFKTKSGKSYELTF